MRTRIGLLVGCAFLGAGVRPSVGAPGRGPSTITWADGARAAIDTWPQEDGCSARTGATATVPFVGPRESAWKFTPAGEIEGEPLAWKGNVFVVGRTGTKRTLHVLSTATGVEKMKQAFDSPLPLAPCLLEGRILIRTGPKTLKGFSVGEKSLTARWSVIATASIGPPTVVGEQVYVVVDGVLQRRAWGVSEPVWPKGGGSPIKVEGASVAVAAKPAKGAPPAPIVEYPRPSVRGGAVYITSGARLIEVDRDDGSRKREGKLVAPCDPTSVRIVVGLADVFVTSSTKTPVEGRTVDTSRIELGDGSSLDALEPLVLAYGIASIGRDWVGLTDSDGKSLVLAQFNGTQSVVRPEHEMATSSRQSWFLDTKVPPTACGDLVLIGGKIYDAESTAVLRLDAIPCVSRAIPVRDRILVAETKSRLAAWKSPAPRAPIPLLRLFGTEGGAPATLDAGTAALDDGRTVTGAFSMDAKSGALVLPGKAPAGGVVPIASVRALVASGDPRRLLLSTSPDDATAAVSAIARAESVADLLALVPFAVATGDAVLSRKVQEAAADRGASPSDLSKTEGSVAALESKSGERDDAKASDVEGQLKSLLAREPDVLVAVASSLTDSAQAAYATALVRAAADRSPYHSGATAWVRSHLPEGLSPQGITDLGEWIDFLETIAADTGIHVFAPGGKGADDAPSAVAQALTEARASWRPDLVGLLYGHLLVIAPPVHPSAITRCLSLGRIVCDQLDADFASIGPRRVEDEVLVSHLFPSQSEYISESTKGLDDPSAAIARLEKTAGHYSPGANVTRIFFPVGDSGEAVLRTYAHELTHHWVARRRPPRTQDEESGDHAGGPGYFIVEGIADFVKDWDYGVPGAKPVHQNASANYADIVASLPVEAVVPWGKILAMPQSEAYALPGETLAKIALRWHLGPGHAMRRVSVYYAQASALTAYLFLAEGGEHRAALFAHLYDHYAGQCDPEKVLKAVGCTADELGARVTTWCKETGSATNVASKAPRSTKPTPTKPSK